MFTLLLASRDRGVIVGINCIADRIIWLRSEGVVGRPLPSVDPGVTPIVNTHITRCRISLLNLYQQDFLCVGDMLTPH